MASPIRDYRDLLVWQKAVDLAVLCEEICDRLPRNCQHVALQIRKAAMSVHANIAEGNGRPTRPDYLRHLGISNGSLRELASHLHFLSRRFPASTRIASALPLSDAVARLLGGLIRALKGGGKPG
jgi:four helix bundle protein